MAAKCTVKFQRSPHGTAAVLMHKGASLNYMSYPRGHKLTAAEARRAKRILMAGCDELAADHKRHSGRVKRGMAGAPAWWPFGHKKPAAVAKKKRNPMTQRIMYIPQGPSGRMINKLAGAGRKRKRARSR